MRRLIRRSSQTAGLPPGSLEYVGEQRQEPPKLTIVNYDAERVEEREVPKLEECLPFKDSPTVTWINVAGIHRPELIEQLGACHGVHPLLLEDILNTEQRPKFEGSGDYLFVVLKALKLDPEAKQLAAEQVSLLLIPNGVISFQETGEDLFEAVTARIRNDRGRIRKAGADHLACALLDAVVDKYFAVLEQLAKHIEDLENELVDSPTSKTLHAIYKVKRELIFLRRSVWPLREVLSGLARGESALIEEATLPYFRDVHDHTIYVVDTTESFRDIISGMHETYLSTISNRMNEVMKVLTIIATIFIPLTFIAGIYGMNFEYMPELKWHWTYPVVWAVMAVVALSMLVYFRRKRWL